MPYHDFYCTEKSYALIIFLLLLISICFLHCSCFYFSISGTRARFNNFLFKRVPSEIHYSSIDSESNFVQVVIPRFDGHYDPWSIMMENFLRSMEYWPIVEDGIGAPTEGDVLTNAQKMEFEGRKLKDLNVKNYHF